MYVHTLYIIINYSNNIVQRRSKICTIRNQSPIFYKKCVIFKDSSMLIRFLNWKFRQYKMYLKLLVCT